MTPRLIASDIDGTFIDHNHRVTKRNRQAVIRAHQAGCHFALSTGRPFRWLAPVLEQLPLRPLCIASNGAVIYDSAADKVLIAHELLPEVLQQVGSAARRAFSDHGGVSFGAERSAESSKAPVEELYEVDPTYSEDPLFDGFGVAPVEKLLSKPCVKLLLRNNKLTAPQMYELISPHIDPQLAHVTYSMNEGMIEVCAPGINKSTGVEWLAQHYGVEKSEVVAFGDMPNDVEMLSWAGLGVAMGNAAPVVKEAADMVTSTNSDSGVAEVLERWF